MTKDAHARRPFDANMVRELADILADTGLTEIEVEKGDLRVRVVREPAPVMATLPQATAPALPYAPQSAPASTPQAEAASTGGTPANAVTSPMVGTVYFSPEPGAAKFVSVGDTVAVGDTLVLIEAMKTFNPIKAESAGTVRQILVEDGAPVEFGQPLMVIE